MKGLFTVIGFIIGLFVGGFFGVVTMCILSVASRDDEMNEDESRPHKDDHKEDNDSDFNDIIGL